MITEEAKQQAELKKVYAMFRVNMVVMWIVINVCYIIGILV